MKNSAIKTVLPAALIFSLSSAVFAQSETKSPGSYGYIGGNYGYLNVDSDDDFDDGFDDDNDAYQGYIGAALNPYVALELGYMDLGSYGNNAARASTEGVTAGVRLTLPVAPALAVYAKAGQMWWETDYRVLGVKGDADGDEPFYGAGVAVRLTDHLGLNVEYVRYEVDLDHDEVGILAGSSHSQQDIDYASVGVMFKF